MKTNIPFTVIGGYLGSGKTTLLNQILRQNDGQRIALLVNDFGNINIDTELIEKQDEEVIELSNGCICCTLAAEFYFGIQSILKFDPLPQRVIVEASGVSDPQRIAAYGQTPGFSLDGVIVVVDAATVREKAMDKYVGRMVCQQIKSADLIILNKIDTVTEHQKLEVMDWLRETSPRCRLIEAQFGGVPIQILLGSALGSIAKDFEIHAHDHSDDTTYQSWSHVSDKPISRAQIECFANGLPKTVLRAKGILLLEDAPNQKSIFQLVGQSWRLTSGPEWGEEKKENRIVVLGIQGQLEPKTLNTFWLECSNSFMDKA
jgi:G3E family GTPase